MSGHKRFTVVTNVQVYFCDLRNPWQRGSNGNSRPIAAAICASTLEKPPSRSSRPMSESHSVYALFLRTQGAREAEWNERGAKAA